MPPAELKRILAVTLYSKGILGIGTARELAGVSKLAFIALLRHEGVPLNYAQEDAEKDIQTVRDLAFRGSSATPFQSSPRLGA